jgi:D-glycero-D-manno-heptose 1,7-bisphosphate phosphatase
MKPAVFFDRDGTLIYDKVYLNDPQLVEFVPGAFECLKTLKDLGFLIIIITNQSGIARGLVKIENMHEIHEKMRHLVSPHGITLDDFFFSPHGADSNHPTRKPNPGMLEEAIQKYDIDRKQSWMVGDRMIDVEAGHRAQLRSILIGSKENPQDFNYQAPEFQGSLLAAADFIKKNI